MNNGDGTFSDHSGFRTTGRDDSVASKDETSQWTTSCLIADLNGDSFADLYDVNYLTGHDVFDRVCAAEDGETIQCSPLDFQAATDRVWLGDGAGGFVDRTSEFLDPLPSGKGLGIVAINVGNNRLSLFVANDTTANFFYTADSPSATSLTETAVTSGLAFNGDGKTEACMGIAVGDCTQDGRLDLLVTNFLHESNTLYSPVDEILFEDVTRQTGLHTPTLSVLGFGAQFLDANLDGRLQLFVVNGYTQDLARYNTPYQMQPHMFEWTEGQFEQLSAGQLGPWCENKVVGRAVAKLDWNLDGKPDLAVGLLDEPSYLLTNTSTSECRHLSLRLISTESARDAIGTTITATIGASRQTCQLTAGDGYQCSNQRRILLGFGSSTQIDRLLVVWPSGANQEFRNVPVSQAIILVEGRGLMVFSR